MRYRKKPVEIEAIQLGWDTWSELCDWIGEFPEGMKGVYVDEDGKWFDLPQAMATDRLGLLIPTLEGTMLAIEGDYVIRGIQGEYYPCKPDIFEASYEPVIES